MQKNDESTMKVSAYVERGDYAKLREGLEKRGSDFSKWLRIKIVQQLEIDAASAEYDRLKHVASHGSA